LAAGSNQRFGLDTDHRDRREYFNLANQVDPMIANRVIRLKAYETEGSRHLLPLNFSF
jgi:hypothetical protein